MGFLDSLGRSVGKSLSNRMADAKVATGYKKEYDTYSKAELKAEYDKLVGKTDSESRLRQMAMAETLKDRRNQSN